MKVILSSRARADLFRIGAFIARDNPARAAAFVAELQDKTQQLANLPRGFPLVPRYERRDIRRRSWKGYGIFYAVTSDRILVYRILGPGQDHDRALALR